MTAELKELFTVPDSIPECEQEIGKPHVMASNLGFYTIGDESYNELHFWFGPKRSRKTAAQTACRHARLDALMDSRFKEGLQDAHHREP